MKVYLVFAKNENSYEIAKQIYENINIDKSVNNIFLNEIYKPNIIGWFSSYKSFFEATDDLKINYALKADSIINVIDENFKFDNLSKKINFIIDDKQKFNYENLIANFFINEANSKMIPDSFDSEWINKDKINRKIIFDEKFLIKNKENEYFMPALDIKNSSSNLIHAIRKTTAKEKNASIGDDYD